MFQPATVLPTLATLLTVWVGTPYAGIIPATIHGEIRDAGDGTPVCALVIINGIYKAYSCSTDGTNRGAPFTLDYDYVTDSNDPSANKLLVFADRYENAMVEITQPDNTITVEVAKMEPNLVFDTLIGDWSVWYSERGVFTERLPSEDCYLPCGPFPIARDDGSTLGGTFSMWNSQDTGFTYTLTATYLDSRTLSWTMERESIPPGNSCTETGTMAKMDGNNMLAVTSDDYSWCWGKRSTEYWIRHSR